MPRTRRQLEEAVVEAEAWLESLDPAEHPPEETADLRAITSAIADVAEAERRLHDAVRIARSNGRSWGRISMALGVSKQAARQRYGEPADA